MGDPIYEDLVKLKLRITGYKFTNESKKGERLGGKTIVNIGLHEGYAKSIINKSDKEIYELVKAEFIKVCPLLEGRKDLLENYDLQRWPEAMPKFDYRYVSKVKDFWEDGQGNNNVYFCGDYLNTPWIEGSITCGKKVAKAILSEGIVHNKKKIIIPVNIDLKKLNESLDYIIKNF